MSPPGYKAPVVKASRCGNERPERSDRRKAGTREVGKYSVFCFVRSRWFGGLQICLMTKQY